MTLRSPSLDRIEISTALAGAEPANGSPIKAAATLGPPAGASPKQSPPVIAPIPSTNNASLFFGISVGPETILAWKIPEADVRWAREQTRSPFLHLSISAASSPLNEWPLDAWSEALRQVWLKSPHTRVVATGAGSERETARLADLVSLVQDERLQIFFDRLPMSRLAAFLKESSLHLGLDSGVLHFAMALDKPTVSLFRDSEGRPGWAPRGEKHRVLLRDCSCNQTSKAACSGSRALCLSKITPTEVAQAALSVLPMNGKG